MIYRHIHWRILAAAVAAAGLLTACGDSGGTTAAQPPPPQQATFSVFVAQFFKESANSMPVDVTNDTFNYDVNEDPTAFDALIAAGSYQ